MGNTTIKKRQICNFCYPIAKQKYNTGQCKVKLTANKAIPNTNNPGTMLPLDKVTVPELIASTC